MATKAATAKTDGYESELTYLKGVGPTRARLLAEELDITTRQQLLWYFPYKYIDRSRIYHINELTADMPFVQVVGTIVVYREVGEGRSRRLTASFTDGTGELELVWFKGTKFIPERYKPGETYLVFGKPAQYGQSLTVAHPDIEAATEMNLKRLTGAHQAFYITTEKMKNAGLTTHMLQKVMFTLFQTMTARVPETLPDYLIKRLHLPSLDEALRQVHFPTDALRLRKARYRLKLEELLYLQLHILRYTQARNKRLKGFPFRTIGPLFNSFYKECLPFELTGAQKRVLREIRNHVSGEVQMNRLVQGDVGSGKTLVALMAMLMALDNGFQACMMAPTEILATQHYENLSRMLAPLPVKVCLLTGSTKKKEREVLHAGLRDGSVQILVGTHALIEEEVQFRNLGLAVIDEQHRFGVEQRSKLWRKNVLPPHILVMTATPIPRTLAMTLYGDLDVSVIDELPPGRKPIETVHRYDNRLSPLYEFMHQQLAAGRQIYVVYPMIEESEKADYKNLNEGFDLMKKLFSEVETGMVHGKLKPQEKDAAMEKFVTGQTRLLVSTTVIEVGVDVPNASMMVIQDAQRFGLSQLHQLRGRVGRGADQSYCVLLTPFNLSQDGRKRIDIMTSTNDGFEISEADLKLRGPGDLEGVQQSGLPIDLHIADITRDGQLVEYARSLAEEILEKDPDLTAAENALLNRELRQRYAHRVNWGVIS